MEKWSTPRRLPEGWTHPSIAFDTTGRAVAGYVQVISESPLSARVAVADLRGAEWVDGFELASTAGDIPFKVVVGVGADGTAAACFSSRTTAGADAKMRHRVIYRRAGSSSWEDPVEIVSGSEVGAAAWVSVEVAPNGLAVVVVDRYDGSGNSRIASVHVSAHPANGEWSPPRQVSETGKNSYGPRLGLDGQGNATIVFVHRFMGTPGGPSYPRNSIRAVTRMANSGVLGAPVVLTRETGNFFAADPHLAVNASGAAVVAAQMTVPGNIGAHLSVTARAAGDSGWGGMWLLFQDGNAYKSRPGAVAITDEGTGYVVYPMVPPVADHSEVGIRRRMPGGEWEPHRILSVTDTDQFESALVVQGDDVRAVFTAAGGVEPGAAGPGVGVFRAATWRSGEAQPAPASDVTPPGNRLSLIDAVSDHLGSLVVTHAATADPSGPFVTTLDPVFTQRAAFPQPGPVTSLAFSPEGTRLALAAGSTGVVVDVATGQPVCTVDHGATVRAIAYRPDGAAVASCGDDGTARLTEVATGTQLARVPHDAPVVRLALSGNAQRMASASSDGVVRVIAFGGATRTFVHDSEVKAVAIDRDGTRVATASGDGSTRVFNLAGSAAAQFTFAQGGTAVQFSPDGTRVAAAGLDGTAGIARVYNTATGAPLLTVRHDGPVHALAFDSAGACLGTASADGTCRVVDLQTGTPRLTLRHPAPVRTLAFSADGTLIATVTTEQVAHIYDRSGRRLAKLRHSASVDALALQSDSRLLATGCADRFARVFAVDGP